MPATAAIPEELIVQRELFAERLHAYREAGLKVFASSSFQTHSIPMLHLISELDASIPIAFLQTGFHFPETLEYRDQIAEQLGLRVINVESAVPKLAQRDAVGRFHFASDPSYCCFLNKTKPMEPLLGEYDVWITGVRRDQNANRNNFQLEAPGPFGTTRFHPMLDWNNKMIHQYRKLYGLPPHPLEAQGYLSIGCAPCTQKFNLGDPNDRGGRWAGLKKTECGLHTDLASAS
ncbi:phosphoadenylyl-sulfate reductase [Lewinella sp. LCG006]|uniref:phosphoadenylyl-sulfate reductase n=1 Tax=Lewinella sp. LCG006 TaxID=3231911 RepID=UPI0034603729